MEQLGSHWTDFYEIWYFSIFFQRSIEKNHLSLKSDKNNAYFTWTSMYIYDHISLNSSSNDKNFSDKSCRENLNTHFTFKNIFFFFLENRGVYEMMWKNVVQRTPYCLPKTTNTHSEYVILIAFPLQQLLQEHASMLPYMYIAGIVLFFFYKSDKFCFKLLVTPCNCATVLIDENSN